MYNTSASLSEKKYVNGVTDSAVGEPYKPSVTELIAMAITCARFAIVEADRLHAQ